MNTLCPKTAATRSMPPQPVQKAFTLIELLTVIAIIGVLAAIILPVVGSVRASARATKCLSNLRNLQLANQLYALDDKENRFVWIRKNENGKLTDKWHDRQAFLQYLAGAKPSASSGYKLLDALRCPDRIPSTSHPSYGYNLTGFSSDLMGTGIKQTAIPRPSQTIAFADSLDYAIKSGNAGKYEPGVATITQTPAYRHNGRINAVFWDGHAASRSREYLVNNRGLIWNTTE